jgi:hypothetical protein
VSDTLRDTSALRGLNAVHPLNGGQHLEYRPQSVPLTRMRVPSRLPAAPCMQSGDCMGKPKSAGVSVVVYFKI